MKRDLIITVGGLSEADNIREVARLGSDILGFDFKKGNNRFVGMLPSLAGTLPDYPRSSLLSAGDIPGRLGSFSDDMPQTIVANVYNYRLDYIQLDGSELPVMVSNLRRTLDPDIRKGIKIIKTMELNGEKDFEASRQYEGYVDAFLFNIPDGDTESQFRWSLFDAYFGATPFLIGNVDENHIRQLSEIRCKQFVGVSVDREFEQKPGVKDIEKLRRFIVALRQS